MPQFQKLVNRAKKRALVRPLTCLPSIILTEIVGRIRASHACDRCREWHAKCSGGDRCTKCIKDDAQCRYSDRKRERDKK